MNKGMQTKVRILSESVIDKLYSRLMEDKPPGLELGKVVSQMEMARQMALISEELHRLNRLLEERGER